MWCLCVPLVTLPSHPVLVFWSIFFLFGRQQSFSSGFSPMLHLLLSTYQTSEPSELAISFEGMYLINLHLCVYVCVHAPCLQRSERAFIGSPGARVTGRTWVL